MTRVAFARTSLAVPLIVALATSAVDAQLVRPAPDARVRSVAFRFEGRHEMTSSQLSALIATAAPGGMDRLKGAVAWLPFVKPPDPVLFDASELQRDRERLRRYYRRQGFFEAKVDYQVTLEGNRRDVKVAFEVHEGVPVMIRSIALVDSTGSAPFVAPADLESFSETFLHRLRKDLVGHRLTDERVTNMRLRVTEALANHGFVRSDVTQRTTVDSLAHSADLALQVEPGRRLQIAKIEVSGVHSVPTGHAKRQLGVNQGDWYSSGAIAKGRANLQSVPLFARSELALSDSAGGDSGLGLEARVTESHARFTTAELGYVTDGAGITTQLGWTHPNFTSGARSLDALFLAQTGWWTTSDVPDKLIRFSLPLTQPYVFSPAVSLSLGPTYEYRDGRVDRSKSWSILTTLLYRFNPLQSLALRYEYTQRHPEELKLFEASQEGTFNATTLAFGSRAILDSLTQKERFHILSLFTSLGHLDNLSKPRLGAIVKPRFETTLPFVYGDIEFVRADLQGTCFLPAPGRGNAFSLRGTLGGLWPFGRSVPQPGESAFVDWIRLRDQVLTAGGTSDVRGYESRLLGPKYPNLQASTANGDTVVTSDYYLPIGGLRRWTLSGELRLGLPMAPPDLAGHLFFDAGRVWTPDPRFQLSGIDPEAERVMLVTGGGMGYYTPVGAIRVDVGYKLNPSVLDVRTPQHVVDAVLSGQPASAAPVTPSMRYHVSLSLGLNF